MIITGSIAGCLSSEEDDNSEYETQIADLEKQLDEKNSTIESIQTQISSYHATIDGLEDAISDATDYISNLEDGLIQEEAYRNSLLLMLEDTNNSNTELQAMLESSNNTILNLQNSLAENQSLLSQASSVIADLVSGWDSTNSTVSDLLQQIIELEASLVDCDTASTVLLEGECVSRNAIWGMITFENGPNVSICQSYRGGFTHHDDSMYSVDFLMSEGTPVVAYKAGKIRSIKEDSNTNCIDEGIEIENCTHANYVVIDHGDFTFSYYLHLQPVSYTHLTLPTKA